MRGTQGDVIARVAVGIPRSANAIRYVIIVLPNAVTVLPNAVTDIGVLRIRCRRGHRGHAQPCWS